MKQFLDQDGVQYFWNKVQQNFANLSDNGKVPANQLPSYVDDVLEYGTFNTFPVTGEDGKIYVAQDTNLTYRWSGTRYVEISQSLALGETSSTAYPGDKGKQLSEDLKAEIGRSKHEDASIREAIAAEQNRAETSEKNNRGLIQKNASDIAIETNNRISGDEALSVSINAEKDARQDADDKEKLARIEADNKEKAERQSEDNLIKAKIQQEQTRAENAEKLISNNLNSEISRAKAAEKVLTTNLNAEITNRKSEISRLDTKIEAEATRATNAETTITTNLNAETSRAKAAEKTLTDNLNAEITNRTDEVTRLDGKIDDEASRAKTAESGLTNNLNTEIARAKKAEQQEAKNRSDADDAIKNLLNTEVSRAKSEESKLSASIATETSRATTAEDALSDRITAEQNRAITAEGTLTDNLNSEISDRKKAIKVESDRAKAAEQQESKSRADADDAIKSLLSAETSRATTAENDISDRITSEKNRATSAENTITSNLNSEISERTKAIKAESDRAKAAEQAIQANLGSITIAKVASTDTTIAASYQLQVNGEAKGITIDVAKDQSIKDINVLDMNATLNDNGTIQAGSPVGSTALCISYILADGTYKLAKLDYSKFLEETEFANGLEVNNHKIYVKVDQLSESFLSVSSAGVKLTGVQNAINTAVDAERVAREAECKQIKDSITQSGQGSTVALDAEIKRAKEAEAAITSNLNNHISDYHNPHKVTKAQVGLSDVDNTSDADKPVSNATQTELDKKANQTEVNRLQQTITNLQTTIQQLQSQITNMSTTIESVQNNITNMQTTINTLPTVDSNDAKYLRKDKNDVTPYTITAKALYKA